MNNENIMAEVGHRQITKQDFQFILNNLDPQRSQQFQSDEGKKQLLEELINQELFYLDALDNNLDKDDAYQKELEKVKENFLKQYAINSLLKSASLEEDEIGEYYKAHREQFKKPATARASHILVDTEEEANTIIEEINQGLAFGEAAKKYSKCPSKAQGGNLNNFSRGQMVPEFEEVVFNMEKDEISQPVKTQFGYHIILLYERNDEKMQSLEEVEQQLGQQLLVKKQQDLYLSKVSDLKDKYKVKVNL